MADDAVDERRDGAFLGFAHVAAKMLAGGQTAGRRTQTRRALDARRRLARPLGGGLPLPGGQLVDVTATVLGPDDDFVRGDELAAGPHLLALAGHRAEQRVVGSVEHLAGERATLTSVGFSWYLTDRRPAAFWDFLGEKIHLGE